MKNKHVLLFSILVMAIQFSYFFVSTGPFMDEGVPASEQLSGGNDDRAVLAFGSVFFAIPLLYALITLPLRFRGKDAISIVIYFFSFTIWAVYAIAVNFDTPLWGSFRFGDWYIAPYLLAPVLPVMFLLHSALLTRRSAGRANVTRL